MNEAMFRIATTTKESFTLVITRSTIPCQYTNKPQKWEYSIFSPDRMGLAYKMYNNAKNLPEHYETHIMTFQIPACFSQRVPYGSLTEEVLQSVLKDFDNLAGHN